MPADAEHQITKLTLAAHAARLEAIEARLVLVEKQIASFGNDAMKQSLADIHAAVISLRKEQDRIRSWMHEQGTP